MNWLWLLVLCLCSVISMLSVVFSFVMRLMIGMFICSGVLLVLLLMFISFVSVCMVVL